MKSPSIAVLLAALLVWPAAASDHAPLPVESATNFDNCVTQEKVSIAAEPYDTPEKQKLFRINYTDYDFLPIRILVTNNSDKTLSLDDVRIIFVTADRVRIAAADTDDVEARLTKPYSRKIPMPWPLPPIKTAPKQKGVSKIEADFKEYEYSAAIIAPHTTATGFLFYDVKDVQNPLDGAKLVFRRLAWSPSGDALYDFELDFSKYKKPSKK